MADLEFSDDLLSTMELAAEIELQTGVRVDRSAIRHWIALPENPLPVAYRGVNGQAHQFDRVVALTWFLDHIDGQRRPNDADPENLDELDWHSARTISARERAKKDILETRRLEGKYADVAEMERLAEDRARHAVLQLRTLPARLAPQLAIMTDELAIDALLDDELRTVCAAIEKAAHDQVDAEPDALESAA